MLPLSVNYDLREVLERASADIIDATAYAYQRIAKVGGRKGMKIVKVYFKDGKKPYFYCTNLNLELNQVYEISTSGRGCYNSTVTVVKIMSVDEYHFEYGGDAGSLLEIVRATGFVKPSTPKLGIKLVSFNEKKRVTVIKWTDNVVTKVTCSDTDTFDKEKGIALCFMKRLGFANKGNYNNVFRKYIMGDKEE